MLKQLKARVHEIQGNKQATEEQVKSLTKATKELKLELDGLTKASKFFQHEADQVQQEVIGTISNLISMALADIFPNPYSCHIQTGVKRNAMEAKIIFEKDGMQVEPKDAIGGGPIDVASFAGRVAFLHLSGDSKVLVADEPFKFVSRDLLDKCPEMLKVLTQLGHQFILISHLPEIIEAADNVIKIENGTVV